MFVKVVRKANNNSEYNDKNVSLFQCDAAHLDFLDPKKPNQARVLMMPSGLEITIRYDEKGQADADVYYMNDTGQTIDKVA